MGVKTAFSHGTMQLNSLIPAACLLVSACQSLGLQGLKEQKTREGKKQVGLPCKTIVEEECSEKEVPRVEEVCEWYNEECKTEYVKHCENNRREKRGVLQAILLASAIASQNPETTVAPARVRCYHSPTTTCRHNYDNSIDGECSTTYHRYCYRARSSTRGGRGEGLSSGEPAKAGEGVRQGGDLGLLDLGLGFHLRLSNRSPSDFGKL